MLGTKYKKVELVKYQTSWRESYQAEMQLIQVTLGSKIIEIQHVGSTSIEGMDAKPTIDILVGLADLNPSSFYDADLSKVGYQFRPDHPVPGRLHYAKIERDIRFFNLSLCVHNQEFWNNHILFRDYLITHPETAQEYCNLKHNLAIQYPNCTTEYTEGKTRFILSILAKTQH
ncbi:MAG: GrpB family protein [Proteobacteria bacterium]|nr:GrpB family protein [Pseudomonadota bacterium]